jgi:uncharacterized NAD(P)/FAD-binding protein YdhS
VGISNGGNVVVQLRDAGKGAERAWDIFTSLRERESRKDFDVTFIGNGFSTAETLRLFCDRLIGLQRETVGLSAIRTCVLDPFRTTSELIGGLAFGERTLPGLLLSASLKNCGCPDFCEWWSENAPHLFRAWAESTDPLIRRWVAENQPQLASSQFDDLHVPRRTFGRYAWLRTQAALHSAVEARALSYEAVCGEAINITHDRGRFRIKLGSGDYFHSRLVVIAIGNTWPRIPPHLKSEPRYFLSMASGSMQRLAREGPRLLAALPSDKRRIIVIGSRGCAFDWLHFMRHQRELLKLTNEISVFSPQGQFPEFPADYRRSVEFLKAIGLLSMYRSYISAVHPSCGPDRSLSVEIKADPAAASKLDSAAIVVNCSGRGPIEYSPSRLLNNLASQTKAFPVTTHKDSFQVTADCEIRETPNAFLIGPLLTPQNFAEGVDSIGIVTRIAKRLSELLCARLHSRGVDSVAPGVNLVDPANRLYQIDNALQCGE